MTRGLPAIVSTRSGRQMAKDVAIELTNIHREKLRQLDERPEMNRRLEAERERIMETRALNLELFGKEDGRTFPRHTNIEDFSDTEIHMVIDDYLKTEEGRKVANSVRGQDAYLIANSYEPPRPREILIEDMENRRKAEAEKKGKKYKPLSRLSNEFLDRYAVEARKDRSVNDNVMEMLIALRTLKICEAGRVTWICPSHPYARQDRSKEREASIAKLMQEFSKDCGAAHAVFVDLHADQIKSFYQSANQSADNLHSSQVLLEGILKMTGMDKDPELKRKFKMVSPDAGAMKLTRWYASRLGLPIVYADKMRDYTIPNSVEKVTVVGDVKGFYTVTADDMIDTAGTVDSIVRKTHNLGSLGAYLVAAHGFMTGPAVSRIDKLYAEGLLKGVLFTNSVHRPKSFFKDHPWCHTASIARMLAETTYHSTSDQSVSGVYDSDRELEVITFPEMF